MNLISNYPSQSKYYQYYQVNEFDCVTLWVCEVFPMLVSCQCLLTRQDYQLSIMRLNCFIFVAQWTWLNKSQDWQEISPALFLINIYFMSPPYKWSCQPTGQTQTHKHVLSFIIKPLNWWYHQEYSAAGQTSLYDSHDQEIQKYPNMTYVQCLMSRNVNKIFFADLEIQDLTNLTHCLSPIQSTGPDQRVARSWEETSTYDRSVSSYMSIHITMSDHTNVNIYSDLPLQQYRVSVKVSGQGIRKLWTLYRHHPPPTSSPLSSKHLQLFTQQNGANGPQP